MSERLKNAFINQYKVEQTDEAVATPIDETVKADLSTSVDEIYDFSDSKLKTFAPSLIVSLILITLAIVVFSAKQSPIDNNSKQISPTADAVNADTALIAKAMSFESVTFLKAKFFDGIESYDLSLPLTLQKSPNRNIIIDFDSTISLSKKKILIDVEAFEGTIEIFLKDSSLQSNNFNPIIIKQSDKKQIYEISLAKLPDNMTEDVNLYRITELRLKLNKASEVTFNSITLQ